MTFTVYRANLSRMQRPQAQKLCDKMYPGCRVISFHESDATDGPVVLTTESKDCGEGKYYCREDKKCKPIPMGYHEREDGYLVKNEAANPAQQAAIAISMKKKGVKPKNETYFYAGDSKEEFKDKAAKKKENKKKKTAVQGSTDVPNFPQDQVSEEAWQRKEGKNKSGGLNEKGRKSYERANPGSDLKAPSKKKGNKRRASFCARMKGMKKKLTSAKTARDPDSRINKSLRAWNC